MSNVNHPDHYNQHPSGVECIDIVRHYNFNLGNVIKYVWRAGLKDGEPTIQDLEKAAWYLQDEIKRRKEEVISKELTIDWSLIPSEINFVFKSWTGAIFGTRTRPVVGRIRENDWPLEDWQGVDSMVWCLDFTQLDWMKELHWKESLHERPS